MARPGSGRIAWAKLAQTARSLSLRVFARDGIERDCSLELRCGHAAPGQLCRARRWNGRRQHMPGFAASYRSAPRGTRISDADPSQTLLLTFVLKPGAPLQPHMAAAGGMSREEYRRRHATHGSVMDQVHAFATAHGLTIESTDPAAHIVKARGTYAQAMAALQPDDVGVYATEAGNVVARSGHIHLAREPWSARGRGHGAGSAPGGQAAFSRGAPPRRACPTRAYCHCRALTSSPPRRTEPARRSASSNSDGGYADDDCRCLFYLGRASPAPEKLTRGARRWQQQCGQRSESDPKWRRRRGAARHRGRGLGGAGGQYRGVFRPQPGERLHRCDFGGGE